MFVDVSYAQLLTLLTYSTSFMPSSSTMNKKISFAFCHFTFSFMFFCFIFLSSFFFFAPTRLSSSSVHFRFQAPTCHLLLSSMSTLSPSQLLMSTLGSCHHLRHCRLHLPMSINSLDAQSLSLSSISIGVNQALIRGEYWSKVDPRIGPNRIYPAGFGLVLGFGCGAELNRIEKP